MKGGVPLRRRFLLYLYSNRNIVATTLALLGLGLYFSGLIRAYWPFIVAGLYLVGLLLTPKQTQVDLQLQQRFTLEDIRSELAKLNSMVQKRVPARIYAKLKSIETSIVEVLPQFQEDGSSYDYNLQTIRQTALEYLPQALEAYLNLPPTFARVHPLRDGKTAEELLLEQLELLDSTMKDIVIDVHQNDSQQLLIHGRFLAKKFAKDSFAL